MFMYVFFDDDKEDVLASIESITYGGLVKSVGDYYADKIRDGGYVKDLEDCTAGIKSDYRTVLFNEDEYKEFLSDVYSSSDINATLEERKFSDRYGRSSNQWGE